MIKITFFKILAKINKLVLPSLSKRRVNIYKLKTWQKALLGYRYWTTKNSLEN
jgi:hypothetical protein